MVQTISILSKTPEEHFDALPPYQLPENQKPIKDGFIRVRFYRACRTYEYRYYNDHGGISFDHIRAEDDNAKVVLTNYYLEHDFPLDQAGGLDLSSIARKWGSERCTVIDTSRMRPFRALEQDRLSGIAVGLLTQSDGFLSIIEDETTSTAKRKAFRHWIRGYGPDAFDWRLLRVILWFIMLLTILVVFVLHLLGKLPSWLAFICPHVRQLETERKHVQQYLLLQAQNQAQLQLENATTFLFT